MKIRRIIDDKEYTFDLTSKELTDAFFEQEFIFDRADVSELENLLSDEKFAEVYGITKEEFRPLIDDMAAEMRRLITKYDMEWTYARDEAVRTILARRW